MMLLSLEKKDGLTQQMVMSNKISSTLIHEKKKAINLCNALVNSSKSAFM